MRLSENAYWNGYGSLKNGIVNKLRQLSFGLFFRLFSHIAQLQARGYYVSFLQSYESWSHDDRMTHIALLTQATHAMEPEKWAIG